MKCTGCGGTLKRDPIPGTTQVYQCRRCKGIVGSCYLGDSYNLVSPNFMDPEKEPAPEALRYFDLECLGSEGITRRHGWYDPATRGLVQVG